MSFPDDFIWGVASAAYQIEGGAADGGRGPSIWDTFSHTPGKTFDGHTGDMACDGYHRYPQDIALMASLGIRHYRFSLSWARLDPQGQGDFNQEGFAYYQQVLDCCRQHGITPYVTLYHWDLPQALEDRGGWQSRATAHRFGVLAQAVAQRFRGQVSFYMTLNEPQCAVMLGYGSGIHAPGKTLPLKHQFTCWHNLLLAHGLAAQAIRSTDPQALVGVASTGHLCYPQNHTKADAAAAKQMTFAPPNRNTWSFSHHMFLDPLCFGHYPKCEDTLLEQCIASVSREDLITIHQLPDFIGLNIYNGHEVSLDSAGKPELLPKYEGFPRTALKWPITPQVLGFGVEVIYQRYQLPIYITENGLSCNDKLYLDGCVHDPDRIDFLHRYLLELKQAVENGVDVRGYFHWSFTDNFEWHNGYNERFGLVYVDYPSQHRILKDSAHWYAHTAAQNGRNLSM